MSEIESERERVRESERQYNHPPPPKKNKKQSENNLVEEDARLPKYFAFDSN